MYNEVTILEEKDFFNFIDYKLAFAVGESDVYLTPKGDYIVKGKPYGENYNDFIFKFGLDNVYGTEDINTCSDQVKQKIIKDYKECKTKWMEKAGVDYDELITLELLHEQYKAIREYSINPMDQDAINTIISTYKITGINCLRYLTELKTPNEWLELSDSSGAQLGIVFTGRVRPNIMSDIKMYLISMCNQLQYYTDEIDRIGLGKTHKETK